jgi:SM-20-related protein
MPLINLPKFQASQLCREPFDYLVVPGFLNSAATAAINADFPPINRPGSFPLYDLKYGPSFAAFVEEMRGVAVRQAFEEKFGLDLGHRPTTFTVRGHCWERDGHIHTDSATKIITVLIYMNPTWEECGGRLRLLRSRSNLDDAIVEVPPEEGTLICFRRSRNSWHGHKPFVGPRRVIQMNWVTSRVISLFESRRHQISAVCKKILLRAS